MIGAEQGKCWGETRTLFLQNNVEVHRIETHTAGAVCSKHKHEHKHNYFYCESGVLKIRVWQQDYDLIDETILTPGEYTTVPPGVYHQFEVVVPGVAYEIYYVELDPRDIIRETVGKV